MHCRGTGITGETGRSNPAHIFQTIAGRNFFNKGVKEGFHFYVEVSEEMFFGGKKTFHLNS